MITWSLQEAATFLGIHADTLRERAAAGMIPGAMERKKRQLRSDSSTSRRGPVSTKRKTTISCS